MFEKLLAENRNWTPKVGERSILPDKNLKSRINFERMALYRGGNVDSFELGNYRFHVIGNVLVFALLSHLIT